jgi:alanyl-tRNA synthetase
MNQFKNVFLGNEKRDYVRATSAQKCVRAGGKHNDLENVGRTARHHTFFEMLGNFSFGDYFKEEAIVFAWELLTRDFDLDPERMWITVFREDDEAALLWKKIANLPDERILRLDEADNFWSMGETGPCGPCSEIHYDFGGSAGKGRSPADPNSDGNRFVEIWNLVFMQYDRSSDGLMVPLPRPSIDTGMGLERLACATQGVVATWDTDLFAPLFTAISELVSRPYEKNSETGFYFRVIADHIRSASFLICDNVFPSNEWRGYVLRRILRRAISHGFFLGMREPGLHTLVQSVVDSMGEAYPELADRSKHVERVVRAEEESFGRTLDRGISNLQKWLENTSERKLDGATAFRLSDTDGLPVDVIQEIAEKRGITVDMDGFEQHMEEQRSRSRANAKLASKSMESYTWNEVGAGDGSVFVGYEQLECEAQLLRWRQEGDETWVVLDQTPFYAESGGQVGDTGEVVGLNWTLAVENAFYIEKMIVHSGKLQRPLRSTDEPVVARVNALRRRDIERNHTATHLLQAALRSVLGDHVHQAGSLVAADRLRFDFSHYAALTHEELDAVEEIINDQILHGYPVRPETMSYSAAVESGATALFGEKYGDEVRVLRIGSNVSTELCGGTHCPTTAVIGPFIIVSEGGIAAGVRRVEALTGRSAVDYLRRCRSQTESSCALLKVATERLADSVAAMFADIRKQRKTIEALQVEVAAKDSAGALHTDTWNGLEFVVGIVDGFSSVPAFREFVDRERQKRSGTIGTVIDAKPVVISFVSEDGVRAGLNAGPLAKKLGQLMGGGGGGRPYMAQSGGKDASLIERAMETARETWRTDAESSS